MSLAMKKFTLPPLDARNVALFIAVACIGMFIAYQAFRFLEAPLRKQQVILQQSSPQPLSAPVKEAVPALASVPAPAPPVVETGRQPTLILNGILCSQDEDLALINGRVVKEGEKIEGAVVRSISEESVVLEFGGKRIILRVQGY